MLTIAQNLDQVSRSYAMQTIYSLNSTAPDMQAVDVRTPGNQWVHGTVRAINMLAHNVHPSCHRSLA